MAEAKFVQITAAEASEDFAHVYALDESGRYGSTASIRESGMHWRRLGNQCLRDDLPVRRRVSHCYRGANATRPRTRRAGGLC